MAFQELKVLRLLGIASFYCLLGSLTGATASCEEAQAPWTEVSLPRFGVAFRHPSGLGYWEAGPLDHRHGITIASPYCAIPATLYVGFHPGLTALEVFVASNHECLDCLKRWAELSPIVLDSLQVTGKIWRADRDFTIYADGILFSYADQCYCRLEATLAEDIVRTFRRVPPPSTGTGERGEVGQ